MEFETKEISPNMKFVPMFSRAAMPNVISSTGISMYVCEVKNRTPMMMTRTITTTVCISAAMVSEELLPTALLMYSSYGSSFSLTAFMASLEIWSSSSPSKVTESSAEPFL